jgi:DNA-binding CsgD family transcriptional regulator
MESQLRRAALRRRLPPRITASMNRPPVPPRQEVGAMGPASRAEPHDDRQRTVVLHGRDAECAAIDALLEGARRSRSGVLVLRADAGMGKSALLDYAHGRATDMRILQTVGVEPEIDLPFAALHRLLRPVFDHIDAIPEIQASALRSALGIAPGEVNSRFVIGLAVLSLLSDLATERPVLCLVDDAHWLDQSSADALEFVARRLQAEAAVMLFAAREHERRSFYGSGLLERRVNELDPADADRLLVERFGPTLAPEIRGLIREAAQGNPLALLEIPEQLTDAQRAGREQLPRPMPIGHDLEEVFLQRVHRLPPSTRLLLLIAAAEGSGAADVILAAGRRLGVSASDLVDAEKSGLIHADGPALAFRHPILRSAIYQGASFPQRQVVHQSLVETLSGEANADRRAWHRAALVLHHDDEVADELERTADRARGRSGHAAAAAALRRASELTSISDRRARRLVAAARASWDAGRPSEATALLRSVDPDVGNDSYAELRHIQGEIEFRCGVPLEGARLLMDGADRVANAHPHKALEMLFDAAHCANWAGELNVMIDAGRKASLLPISETQADASLVDILAGVAEMAVTGSRARLLNAVDRVEDTTADPRWLIWTGAAEEALGNAARADSLRKRAAAIARSSMAVGTLTTVLEPLAWADMMHGRVAAASLHSEEGLQLAIEAGLPNAACFHQAILAWVAAIRGEEKKCFSLAQQASETATSHGLGLHNSIAHWALGLLFLGRRRWDEAADQFQAVSSSADGQGHPYVAVTALPDLVEAAVRADRRDAAESGVRGFLAVAHETSPDWYNALASRSRALIADDRDAKEQILLEALASHQHDGRPFNHARTRLLLGEHLRRERRRAEARPHLRNAVETFQRLGTTPWEKRARAELRATGERARRREPSTVTQLTPQQIQIARLVAEGATNKEVATQLFLSPRTVDYHLRNVFAKLGITSRNDLIRLRLDELSSDMH